MSERNGSTRLPATRVAHNMFGLVRDVITLGELQARLTKAELQDWTRGLLAPALWLVAAAAILLGTIPVLLISLGYALIAAGLPAPLALALAALVGLAAAAAAGVYGRRRMLHNRDALKHSHEELVRNVDWLKQVLHHHADPDACQPTENQS